MIERRLFDFPEMTDETAPAVEPVSGRPRLRVAQRDQIVMRMLALDQMLPAEDEARTVVAFVEQCDLSQLYEGIKSVAGNAGTPPIDPQILLSL